MADRTGPPLPVELRLDGDLARACRRETAVTRAVERAARQVLREVGLPGRPEVVIAEREAAATRPAVLELWVAGRRCRYRDALLRWVQGDALDRPPDPVPDVLRIGDWLLGLAGSAAAEDRRRLAGFFASAVGAILRAQPSVLLAGPQLGAYRDGLPPVHGEADGSRLPPAASLRPVLAELLDLGISLADTATVARTLAAGGQSAPHELLEELLSVLAPKVVELHLSRGYLEELTTAYGDRADLFTFLRDGMRRELGMRYPPFRLVADDQLAPGRLAVRVNHRLEPPVAGLGADQCLVYIGLDQLGPFLAALGTDVQPVPTLEPAFDRPGAILPLALADQLRTAGLTVWNPIEYLVLYLASVLRRRSAGLLTRDDVERWLDELGRPALVEAVRARLSTARLTAVLRALVAEQVPIDDLGSILDRLLDDDGDLVTVSQYLASDDRRPGRAGRRPGGLDELATLLAFVRAGLQRQICAKATAGMGNLPVYLLDQEIEGLLAERQADRDGDGTRPLLSEEEHDRLAASIADELGRLSPSAWVPAILTTAAVRGALGELLALPFPRVMALAYEELPPDVNVQPVARISLLP